MNETKCNLCDLGSNHIGLTCAQAKEKAEAKRAARNKARRERDAAMRSCGLVKVRGALGGVYWE